VLLVTVWARTFDEKNSRKATAVRQGPIVTDQLGLDMECVLLPREVRTNEENALAQKACGEQEKSVLRIEVTWLCSVLA
jgi:hypothetical protein